MISYNKKEAVLILLRTASFALIYRSGINDNPGFDLAVSNRDLVAIRYLVLDKAC